MNKLILRIHWFFSLVAFCCLALLGNDAQSQTYPLQLPTAYPANSKVNFIRTWTAASPEQNPNTLPTRVLRDVQQVTQYFDGLGRPIQTVAKQGSFASGSAEALDLIAPNLYDNFGRETYSFLPAQSTMVDVTRNNGEFKLNPFAQLNTFYDNAFAANPLKGQNDNVFYGLSLFESSPINRVLESASPGLSWTGTVSTSSTEQSRRTVQVKQCTNTTIDAVRVWNVSVGALGSFSSYSSPRCLFAWYACKNHQNG